MKTDRARQERQWLLVGRVKQAFVSETFFQFLEFLLKAAGPLLDERAGDELVLAPRFIDIDLTVSQHLQPVAQRDALAGGITAKHHAGELGTRVFQGKINVAAGLNPEIRHLPVHPAGRQSALEQFLHPARELRDGLHATRIVEENTVGCFQAVFFLPKCFRSR